MLKPDLMIMEGDNPKLILDTKWKCLKTDDEDRKNGIPQSDMYQMYAYANRFDCVDNVLLYPDVTGVTGKTYSLEGTQKKIRTAVIKLNLDLMSQENRKKFLEELKNILHQAVPTHFNDLRSHI
jgi:5-methylcytosine-specific restriction enzyme subunit McrC